ncbi:MAG: hypothetical protein JJU33_03170 [Phycisphaerales bacterium]|nr:hypothetical protein [Phycisphaerales bacterium]
MPSFNRIVAFLLLLALAASGSLASPLVIAHRGASGYVTEHTMAAYAMAYAQGADMLEPDVVLSADGVLICSHDLTLERTTDAPEKFPDRARDDGKWYVIDFTLEELKSLSKRVSGDETDGHTIVTLDELLSLIAQLNRSTGGSVGVIPEPKSPAFHRREGQPIEPVLLETLARHGYTGPDDGGIVQCFDIASIRRMVFEHGSELPMVWLLSRHPEPERLRDTAAYLAGIGPSRKLIENDSESPTAEGEALLELARELGLAVYPYTFCDDQAATARFFHRYKVDGVFTDFPDVALRAREAD